jgi:hypothetical protein
LPYIGNTPAEKYAAFDVQYFTTSATTSYTLDHAVANELDIRLVINNVIQEPGSGKAYTATGTTLTLSAATAGTDTMYCVYTAKASQTVNPPAGSVGPSQIANNAVDLTSKVTGTLPIANGGTGSTATTFVNATTNITGVVPAANLGTGTASSSTVLYGDGTFKAEPGGALTLLQSVSVTSTVSVVNFNSVFSSTYTNYFFVFWNVKNGINNVPFHLRFKDTSDGTLSASVYDWAQAGGDASGNRLSNGGIDNSSIQLSKNQSGGGPTAGKAAFTGVIYAPRVTSYASSDNRPTINWQAAYARSDELNTIQGSGVFDNGTQVGGIQVYGDNGGGPSTYTDRFEGKIYGIADS